MLSINWLVLVLTLATFTRSDHYHIMPVDSTNLCHDYQNGTCFNLEQLLQTDLLSSGDSLTLSFLPGDHVLTEQFLVRNFSQVHITSQNESTAVVRFHSNGVILFVSIAKLSIQHLRFIGANMRPQNSHQGLIIDNVHDVYINNCYLTELNIRITNTPTATIESTLFMSNCNNGWALYVEADDVYITNNKFNRNGGGAVNIESNHTLINNTEFNYNSAGSGGAVEVISGTVVITWCTFTNNKAFQFGGAIHVNSGSVSISGSTLTNNKADNGGAICVNSGSVSISGSTLTNNSADNGGAISCDSGSVSISDSTLTNNRANEGGAIDIDSGSLIISDSTLKNNYGGAIYVEKGRVFISDSTLTNNEADRNSGAIDVNSGSAIISKSELKSNRGGIGGAIGVYNSSVVLSDSRLTNNKADYGGAICVNSGSVSISGSTLTNNSADNGGAISCDSGSVSISDSTLTNNRANEGGAIDIDSGSLIISDSTLKNNYGGAIYVEKGRVFISDSTLTNNEADRNSGAIDVNSGSAIISKSELKSNRGGIGGAIGVYNSSVVLSDSRLTNNKADYGGAICVNSGSVIISDSTLSNSTLSNISADDSGAVELSRSSTLILNNTNITNNMVSLSIQQSKVTFIRMNIISNNRGPVYAFDSHVEFNGPTTLSNNHGVFGGAINAFQSQMYINTEGVVITNNTATSGGGIFLRESALFVNEPIKIYHNTATDGGGIYAYSSRVEFQSVLFRDGRSIHPNKQSEIVENVAESGAGIHAIATTIKLTRSCVNIDSNTAKAKGGGVYLQQSSKLYLFKKDYEYPENMPKDKLYVTLMISNNSAQYGGGIFVADDTESGACSGGATDTNVTQTILDDCFIQTINLHREPTEYLNLVNTFMTNNTATLSGADIYGGLLDRCTASKNAEYHISSNRAGSDYIRNTIKFSIKSSISSRPVQVIFCNKNYISTKKGHMFKISVMAVDQVGNAMNATICSSIISKSGFDRLNEGQTQQRVGKQCTELEYNVFSQDSFAQVELYAEGPCINLGISTQLLNIYFLPCICPIGLKPILSDTDCKCDCDPVLQQGYQITNCSEENGTIELESNNNIWIEFINTTNGTGYVVSNCTFDYCVEKPVNISLSSPDEQCAYNRSGVLCGECEPGLSLVLATSRCEQCSDIYLLLLIPFALAGIFLVALILILNITIATGKIHGLIFYANMIAANRAIFLPNLNNFMTGFVSWVNLDLGIETCFYNGMNSQAKVLLQLVFPAYLFLLMFLIIILSKYFDSFAKLLSNRNPVAALGTLVLLSYSKLLRFIIAALQYRVLDYPPGTTNKVDYFSSTVWLYDGNVQYFTPDHIPPFVAAAIILIAGGLFTVLLFFGQWFPRCSKVMKWTKNTKYIGFMDAYHAPFTPKHRYWVGLLLFALIVHNLVVAMAPDTSLPVLSSEILSVGLVGWKLLNSRLYKSTFCDSLETLYLLNVATLAFGTSYVKDTKKDQSSLANTSMAISFILFVTTLCYHFYQLVLMKSNTWLKIEERCSIKNFGASAADMRLYRANNGREMHQLIDNENDNDELLEVVDNYEQDPPYTDGAVEEADPDRYITPPIIRSATRPDQLRLSYMDELAPLTIEDYRPAPPPSRVNHHLLLHTHAEFGCNKV